MMNKHGVRPLGRKIVAAILGTTLLALVLAFFFNLLLTLYTYRQDAMDKARALADLVATSMMAPVDFDDPLSARQNLESLSLLPGIAGAAVYLGDGTLFVEYGKTPRWVVVKEPTFHESFSSLVIAQPVHAGIPGAVLVISVSLDKQWAVLGKYFMFGSILFVGVFVFSFKMAGVFRRKLGDPLQELTSAVRDISRNKDYSRRVRYVSNDELGVLMAEFNAMLGRIEQRDAQLFRHREQLEQKVEERTLQLQRNQLELLQNNRLLLAEIKKRAEAEMIKEEVERINRHDLKSGLSLVIGYPEILLQDGNLTREQQIKIKRIRAAGYRMLDMIRNHLDMFKMEKGIYELRQSSVDLVELVCTLEEEFFPLLESRGVQLVIRLDGNDVIGSEVFQVNGEESLIRAMFRNLIQNAIEASSRGQTVFVAFKSMPIRQVCVSNPTVVPEDIRHRFFDKYVTHGKENGTGLGTYIAALIARTHGATLGMKTSEEQGTTMTVVFRNADGTKGTSRKTAAGEDPSVGVCE